MICLDIDIMNGWHLQELFHPLINNSLPRLDGDLQGLKTKQLDSISL
jgi:hypothetical protein